MRARVGATVIAVLVGALAGACTAAAQVATGHSGWVWANPLPQGEPLLDVSFAGGAGYAVGEFGSVLRTVDGGATWTNLPTGLFGTLNQVDAVTATTVVVGGGCVLRRSDDGGKTFVRLPWTARDSSCQQPITAIDFPTPNAGYLLLAGGTILRTQDGGLSWARATAPPGATAAIVFSSASTGFAASNGIFMTTDGGSTWTVADASATSISALALDGPTGVVAFAGSGPVAPSAPTLYASGDSGRTWASSTAKGVYSFGYNGSHLDCQSGTGCLLSGDGAVFLTTDGVTFANATPTGLSPIAAAFAGPKQAATVTRQGIPAVSTDGGATFSAVGGQLPPGLRRVRVGSGTLATLSGPGGELALTSDAGANWAVLDTPTTNAITDASFLSPTTGYALDSTGAVLRTGNVGSSWQTLGAQPGFSTILDLDGVHVLLAGTGGIERSSDGGQAFARVVTGADINELEPAGPAIVASGPSRAYASTDGGASWRKIALPPRFLGTEVIRQLAFTTARAGFLVGTAGRVFATRDGGARWREVLGIAHGATQAVAFTSVRNGWAAEGIADGTPGEVLRTSDGGRSWRPQRVGALQIQELVAAGHQAYALDGIGDVFTTNSTGDLGGASSIALTAPRTASKGGRVTVTGRLVPGLAGASVEISYRAVAVGHWVHRFVTVGGGGRFSIGTRIQRATAFVAQWAGDGSHRGAGSAVASVAR